MAKQTYTKDERKAQFLKAGVAMAKKDSIAKLSVAAVAKKCGVTAPLVFHVFGTRENLQLAVKREAKKLNIKLADPKPAKVVAPARKRSVAEVRAIKDKAAGKKNGMVLPETVIGKKNVKALRAAQKKADAAKPAKVAAKKSSAATGSPRKVVRSAKSGKFVDKSAAKKHPATTVTQKFPTQPAPAVSVDVPWTEPKNSL